MQTVSRDQSTTVRYRTLFRHREFSALFCADTASRAGGQLGKVALSVLVYERTDSPGLAAATFAISYLPGLIGGPVLGTLADRLPRRALMIGCDLIRTGLTLAIASVPLPIPVALALLLVVELIRSPFGAARMAILADILHGERFTVGNALVGASQQAVQVLGFGLGGFVVIALGPRPSLIAHAATYLISALIVAALVRRRPAPRSGGVKTGLLGQTAEGIRVVARTRRMPTLFVLLFIGPTALGAAEGLAVPYGYELGGGQALGGMLLAAAPLGAVFGLTAFGRMSAAARERRLLGSSLLVGLSIVVAGGAPFLFGDSSPPIVLLALFTAGIAMGHMAHLQASIVQLTSPAIRGRVISLANTVLHLGQAVSALGAGAAAENGSVGAVLCWTGLAAGACTLAVGVFGAPYAARHRAERRRARRAAPVRHRADPFDSRSRTESGTGEGVRPTPVPGRTPPSPYRQYTPASVSGPRTPIRFPTQMTHR